MHWQQFTGPVMAKGFEDTFLYAFTPFLAANEVGGNPAHPFVSTAQLHDFLAARASTASASLNATATHDTKRGEDVRARLAVLSEVASEWEGLVAAWANEPERAGCEPEACAPSAADELLLLQTLVGTWPLTGEPSQAYARRIRDYMVKAVREEKARTTWREPVPDYESAIAERAHALITGESKKKLRDRVRALADRIALPGALNSLAQLVVKITAPGLPDFYQGSEIWNFTLVDPDNRRAVDFDARRVALRDIEPQLCTRSIESLRSLVNQWRDGRIKFFVTAAALRHRREHSALFRDGDYLPLTVLRDDRRLLGFARHIGREWSLTFAARFHASGDTDWTDTVANLPAGAPRAWRAVFTNEAFRADARRSLRLAGVLEPLPVSILYARA
jgi:(1->4)-alpha-D-glucan 1-alpha-D-glucosylmutase